MYMYTFTCTSMGETYSRSKLGTSKGYLYRYDHTSTVPALSGIYEYACAPVDTGMAYSMLIKEYLYVHPY